MLQIWFRALRLPSLTSSLIPVMLGGAFALIDRAFHVLPFLMALVGAMVVQAGTYLLNDYYDHKSGVDYEDPQYSSGVIRNGWLTPVQVLRGGFACYILAALFGVYFTLEIDARVIWFGLIGLVLGFLYTGGPFPLANKALGEVAVFLAMGPLMVLGTYFVEVGIVRWQIFAGSVPIGLLAAAVTYTNNLRDRQHDVKVGKITIANVLSESAAKRGLTLLLLFTYLIQFLLVYSGIISWYTLITAIALPVMVGVIRKTGQAKTPLELNLVLGLTVLLQLLFGVLYTLGLFISAVLG
jgi:1,4-dihydroxy-2-naphthoate octaprenyltransferase